MRTRTRSPSRTGSGSMPGKTRLFQVHMLKSVISETRGSAVPGSIGVGAHHEDEVAIDAPEVLGSRGCTMNMPIMPMPICTISSECGWYMKVPLALS